MDSVSVRAQEIDRELALLQQQTRLYLGTWLCVNGALAGGQAAVALSTDSALVRSNYWVGAGLSAAGIGALLIQRWPGFNAYRRLRHRPNATAQDQLHRIGYGEQLIARQRAWDRAAITGGKHLIAATVALVSGLRAGFSFGSTAQGLVRGFGVLSVLELQILTRPGGLLTRHRGTRDPVTVGVAPWLDGHVQGVRVVATR